MEANAKIYVTATGGPEQLKLVDAPIPVPGAGELLLRVEAVGVAFADVVMRLGFYPGVKVPFTPGYEVVGRVAQSGRPSNSQAGRIIFEVGSKFVVLDTRRKGGRERREIDDSSIVQWPIVQNNTRHVARFQPYRLARMPVG